MLFRDNYVWESCMDSSDKLKNIKKELGQDPGFFFQPLHFDQISKIVKYVWMLIGIMNYINLYEC